ncbi:MAG: DUF4345 domain-containing protein [Antarcticimicrobium sp.]|uniref:DUF4345 domain-containing protein n=1 Tax=Antarcticimicrobium sp. TaxID=2824147 RepID=UPI00262E3C4F|nr:DUF4345 domain-containing protein [Antarcticimicrobium sp.]MDF1716465.1 DUF4345 domain-containing protein [Antarcticimicrobium sp.]
MSYSIRIKLLLLTSGLVSAGVGFAVLFLPVGFHAGSGIVLGGNLSLMSEMRAPGALLLAAGGFILASVVVARWQYAATLVSAAVFLSYGLARIYSIVADGMPHETLLTAAGVELFVGLLSVLMIPGLRKPA